MHCWKSVNLKKDFGRNRLYIVSLLISIFMFILLYVPFSIIHGHVHINENGILPLLVAIAILPTIHSFMHILPLIIMNKRVKVIYYKKYKLLLIFNYYTKTHLTKKASLFIAIAPTLFLTLPGLIASYLFPSLTVYFLILTSIHIGLTFIDFLYMIHIIESPKQSFIDNRSNEFDILVNFPD